ncbi:MAG: DUF4445 domain-containing protein [Acholeplasmataceae bacterium]|nr:DUF4445 domain-containing protein [Acholeplasmataceae bacterium]
MIRVEVIEAGQTRILQANPGDNLLRLLQQNGFFVQSPCGGRGLCNKCLVKLLPEGNFVKCCQTQIETDLQIEVFPTKGRGLANWNERRSVMVREKGMGVAVDLGTTTLAIYLVDLENSRVLSTDTCLNRQVTFGADVISRIKAANEGHLEELAELVCEDINRSIAGFKQMFKLSVIDKLYLAGNPTMLHIIARVSPKSLGVAPYVPEFIEKRQISGNSLHLDASEITLMPSISAFIGGDITMGMVFSELEKETCSLLVDLGTNGEMVLKTPTGFFATSTATGPAFEGATITMGMGGVEGAINRVELIDDELLITTVGGAPRGISGSGLVDLVAILVKIGFIDETGRFDPSVHHPLGKCFQGDRFYLTENVFVNQADIREFQLAKSAIISGVLTLAKVAKVTLEQIETINLAGGFGFYLDLDNLLTVGIFPEAFRGKIRSLGNASGQGLIDCLLDNDKVTLATQYAKESTIIDLASLADFVNLFVEHMWFTPGGDQG